MEQYGTDIIKKRREKIYIRNNMGYNGE